MNLKSFSLAAVCIIFIFISCERTSEYESPFYRLDSLYNFKSYSSDLAIDKFDNKWIATSEGLLRYNNSGKKLFTRADGLNSDTVYRVVTDKNGNVWSIGANNGVCQFNGKNFIIHNPSTRTIPKMIDPTALMVDHNNHLWVGAYLGLYEFDGAVWKNYESRKFATNMWARKIFPDPENEGSLLITTYDHTIIRFDGSNYQQLDKIYDISPYLIEYIIKDETGAIYCGLEGKGLLIRTRGTNSYLSISDDIYENSVYRIVPGNNNRLWLGTGRGLCYVENGKVFDYRFSEVGMGYIGEFALDSRGIPWISVHTRLVTFK